MCFSCLAEKYNYFVVLDNLKNDIIKV
jgi:hypothetical protein